MTNYLKIVCASLVAAVSVFCMPQEQSRQNQQQDQDDPIVIRGDDENAVSRRDFMRTKLMYSQNIFAGLTTGDFAAIEEAVHEVQQVTAAEQWVAIDNDRYRKLTAEFKTSTDRLMEAAKTKNIDAIALRYYSMSTSCIDCHKHIRKAQYEF